MAGSRHLPIGSASRFRGFFFSQCSPQKLTQCSYSFAGLRLWANLVAVSRCLLSSSKRSGNNISQRFDEAPRMKCREICCQHGL